MLRTIAGCGILLVFELLRVSFAQAALPNRTIELRDVLAKSIHFHGIQNDPKATFSDALDQVVKEVKASEGVPLTFDINENAFKAELPGMDIGKMEVANPNLPAMDATLDTVLKKILSRINVPSRAVYVLRKDCIEITTGNARYEEFYPDWAEFSPYPYPLVVASFESSPLDKALRELAQQSNRNVILDVRVGKAGKTPVSADFMNVPLDEALLLLADLDSVPVGRSFYITTKDNAKTVRANQERRKHEWMQMKKQPRTEAKPEPRPVKGSGKKPVCPALNKSTARGSNQGSRK